MDNLHGDLLQSIGERSPHCPGLKEVCFLLLLRKDESETEPDFYSNDAEFNERAWSYYRPSAIAGGSPVHNCQSGGRSSR